MKRSLWIALACVGGVADAAEPSVCARLASEARRLSAAAWDKSEPLEHWIQPSHPASRKRSPTERALANDAYVRDMVPAPSAEHVGVHRLRGTPLYLVDFVAGTAHCQHYALVEARVGRPPLPLTSPLQPTLGLCMGARARLTHVMNKPALVEGGAPSAGSPEGGYRVAVWAGQGWGSVCRLSLRLRTQMTPTQRFCAPGSTVCDAGQAMALRLATAYEMERSGVEPWDEQPFASGRQPDGEVLAALNPPPSDPGAVGDISLPMPRFGAEDPRPNAFLKFFSNASPKRMPVFIDGRWWLAIVGRAGVGWREGDAVNVALFAPPGRAADAVASYQFGIRQTGLLEATAVDEPR